MRKAFLLVLTALSIISCNHEQDQVNNMDKPTQGKILNIQAREASDNPYGADAENPKVLDASVYPLTQEQTDGVAKVLGSKCKTTAYFHGVNTHTMWFHVECSGTHYIIAYYEDTDYWGHPWVETGYDTGIWHGGHKREAKGEDETPEQQAAADALRVDQKQALTSQTNSSTNRAISCHTDYLYTHSGHACVTINGHLFNVSWTDVIVGGPNHVEVVDEPVYTATPVKTCGC